jgi:hypothetical protein
VPAAAVIPAPIAYINSVAVKKLVVGCRWSEGGSLFDVTALLDCVAPAELPGCSSPSVPLGAVMFTLKKLECSKQARHA